MLLRFSGDSGRRLTVEALASQKLVAGNIELAKVLAERVQLFEVQQGVKVISQGAADNDVYFIVMGKCDVVVNGKYVASRSVNDHFGEMAAITPAQVRSASVIAAESCVLAKISEHDLSEIASRFPELYKHVSRELTQRLTQRNAFVRPAREKIRVFIISSVESIEVARTVQNAFNYDSFTVTVWTDGVFRVTNYVLESLEAIVNTSDFAIAIAHADDVTAFRGKEWPAPRDNVVFELGLFLGRLGRDRAVLMEPRDAKVKMPSDLAGITTITYQFEKGPDAAALMAPACNVLREHILRLGPNNNRVVQV